MQPKKPIRFSGLFRRFVRNDRGATAVEYALVAPIFLLLLVGQFELAYMMFTSVVVDGATNAAARLVRTGQVQTAADPVSTFQTQLCNNLFSIISCGSLSFDVRTASTFAGITFGLTFNEDGTPTSTEFSTGTEGDIVVVTVTYQWTFYTPLVYVLFGDNQGSTKRVYSTAVFRNEPYL